MIVADLQGKPLYGPGSAPPELRAQLEDVLRRFFEARPKHELVSEGQRRNLIIAEVAAPADLLASEHLRERGFFQTLQDPETGRETTVPGAPYRSEGLPWTTSRPPRVGEHNLDIYEGLLGLSRPEIITLRAVGAA
jgi:crotonobetainyl-CoA:carnitine CoA-transferase CaiB-like acyl-CoA transferase